MKCSLLHRACEKGRLDIMNHIFNTENLAININELSKQGSALHAAIIGDQNDVVTYLLDKKIDPSIRDSNNNTAIHLAFP